jgi:hypothetical protein
MAPFHFYRIAGLGVASEIALAGVIGTPETAADVIIRFGQVPRELDGATDVRATYQVAGERFLVLIPGIARFLLMAGREIVIEAEPGAEPGDVAVFVTGTVFGIALHQRGQFVLHASAVRVGSRAVLFCGASGAGKSTMAATLAAKGYPVIADDICAVSLDDGAPFVQSDGRRLKLWSNAVDALGMQERRGEAVRAKLHKYYVDPPSTDGGALPLGALYALRETRAPATDGIERPNIVDATLLVRRNAYRPRLVRTMNQGQHYLQSAAAVIARAGVFVLHRPLEFRALPATIGTLEAHWREIGLLGDGR